MHSLLKPIQGRRKLAENSSQKSTTGSDYWHGSIDRLIISMNSVNFNDFALSRVGRK